VLVELPLGEVVLWLLVLPDGLWVLLLELLLPWLPELMLPLVPPVPL
jgi:hypothetical protein